MQNRPTLPAHEFAALVNELTAVAREYSNYSCLRALIRERLVKYVEPNNGKKGDGSAG